ncbi:MAG: hypothetical protein Q9220_003379 [cf. Caloplaca sp. 1 TL-2023]
MTKQRSRGLKGPASRVEGGSNDGSAPQVEEVLESLAYSNHALPKPRPIDSAVFFDLVKIRRAIEDAADLAVRAASGITSSSLRSLTQAQDGRYGGRGAAPGPSFGGAKLSRERKHKMRQLASQKLSAAYHLDEIATSVATMQSASTLEEVAKIVLQQTTNDTDANYVHFFHEKIPSRMFAEYTSFQPLDAAIRDRPADGPLLRTRAFAKVLKNDFSGAIEDLTKALATSHCLSIQHHTKMEQKKDSNAQARTEACSDGFAEKDDNSKIHENEQPSSLKAQLLFHRAGAYLALACQNIASSLDVPQNCDPHDDSTHAGSTNGSSEIPLQDQCKPSCVEARKAVKSYAKRALRDYLSFLILFEYASSPPIDGHGLALRSIEAASRSENLASKLNDVHLESPTDAASDRSAPCEALVSCAGENAHQQPEGELNRHSSQLPLAKVFSLAELFAPSPPPDLPPYPVQSTQLSTALQRQTTGYNADAAQSDNCSFGTEEGLTYHPLLTEALHSLLLCHALVQTPMKEHLRHAHMVARLTRLCDGYPIFATAKASSCVDWSDIIARTDNWIGLEQSWEDLCAPVFQNGQRTTPAREQTQEQIQAQRREQAFEDALTDERVCDEATFHAALAAREQKAKGSNLQVSNISPASFAQWPDTDGDEGYPGSERAVAIARWVKEAPVNVARSGRSRRSGRRGRPPSGDLQADVVPHDP